MTPGKRSLSIPDRKVKQAWLLQQDVIDSVTKGFGIDGWLTVYSTRRSDVENTGIFCALVPNGAVDTVLQKTSWDLSVGAGMQDAPCTEGTTRMLSISASGTMKELSHSS